MDIYLHVYLISKIIADIVDLTTIDMYPKTDDFHVPLISCDITSNLLFLALIPSAMEPEIACLLLPFHC